MALHGKVALITGGTRGIGLAIGHALAREGAHVAIAAKTVEPHPKLPGTIHSAAEALSRHGPDALGVACDVRSEESVQAAVAAVVQRFGRIDILVNNASAIALTGTQDTPVKKYDLMADVNTRGTFLMVRACLPHLLQSNNPHVLTLSPPLQLEPAWFGAFPAYALSKYGMSLLTLGFAREFRAAGVAFNALWPRTMIATAAIDFVVGDQQTLQRCRQPEVIADAAAWIVNQPSRALSGEFLIDEQVLVRAGGIDLDRYASLPRAELEADLFVMPEGTRAFDGYVN
jgi:citronellol/citronellal dehydrogenase